MTIKEAIKLIKGHKCFALGRPGGAEAFDMAVEALEFKDKIVYCKDCKYFATDDMVGDFCKKHGEFIKVNDFCSKGELRDDNKTIS